jgi:hypothetical protein
MTPEQLSADADELPARNSVHAELRSQVVRGLL